MAVAIAVIVILLLVTIAVAAMLVRVCRRKAKREKQERVSGFINDSDRISCKTKAQKGQVQLIFLPSYTTMLET